MQSVRIPHKPLAQWLTAAAERAPGGVALEAQERRLSYAQLLKAVRELSEQLRALGLRRGDRVGIAAERSAQTIVAILAVVDSGLAYVPLDMNYPAERLAAMLADANPSVVLGEPEALSRLREMVGEFPTLGRPRSRDEVQAVHAAADDLTYVLFTSGSTGRPKGVAMGARPLAHLIEFHAAHPRLGQPARTLQFAPLSFDVHFQEIFSTLACAGTLVLVPEAVRRDPAQLHAALCDAQIERLFLPYVALQMLADASRERVPQHLREVISAGEQLQITAAVRSLFERLPQAQLHNHYGPTETHVVTAHELSGDARDWPALPPIGVALPHVQLHLRDPESGGAIDGDTGELMLGGQTLAHGYLGRPELTAERFHEQFDGVAGRWYATGDLVRRDAAGVYTYLGRADQQLKVDGFRIEPGEIEVALMAHAAVREAVVTAPELAGIGRQLVAYLVLHHPQIDMADLSGELRMHLRRSLPEYMVPVRYMVLAELPVTASGKINRRALPAPEIDRVATFDEPLTAVRAVWRDLLGVQTIADDRNVFDLGARSLLVLKFVTRLKEQGFAVSVADVYDRPTVAGIAALLGGGPQKKLADRRSAASARGCGAGIAIVGMAVRTAGAADLDAFWENLLAGREGIRHYAAHELDESIPESVRSRANFVAARGALQDVDRFDAGLFGLSAREATVLDPQQRLLLELSWTALEHANIDTARSDALVGVYAGSANNSYIAALRQAQPELIAQYSEFATMLASEKDYVATRIAHRLNLHGPAVSIHTACSTGLVAVAQAWQALNSGQCDLAIAGAATVVVPQEGGYLYVEGGMESADGHCRPFDADASGTVFASGGAVVVLKRLEDARADGDTIYAVIRGVGLNNDGANKASFSAPSVSGQAGAIRMALQQSGINARSIGYVEAHGTGTVLGDPIEIAALTRAWREDTAATQYCAIGSVKSNLGHTMAAAGVIGLIKTALALHRQMIPATLHYRRPNPQIDFAATPFRVVAANTPWLREAQPRRAAVSSFGVGGTNAHAVLEEAPLPDAPIENTSDEPGLWVLPLSARTPESALSRAHDLAAHLEQHPDVSVRDVAATLMRGRREMHSRISVVAGDVAQAIEALRGVKSAATALAKPRLVFLFPGQGSQHPGMARRLYDHAPAFHEALNRCLAAAGSELNADFKYWLIEAEPDDAAVAALLSETRYAQPALFAMSYSLATWLDSLSIRPQAMIGHSIGEYTAACLAGVMTPEAAMRAVIARGAAMFEQPRGAMLAVRSDAATTASLAPKDIEIAGINAPELTVVAGPADAIAAFAKTLAARAMDATRLRVSHGFHSAAMDGALAKVATALGEANLQAPSATVYSCVTGEVLQAAQATDPNYWARQVRCTVQFSRAVQAELAHQDALFVEVGPGTALTALLRQHRTAGNEAPRVVPLLGPAQNPGDPAVKALQGVGALWSAGVNIAWPVPSSARRIALPTYPFHRQSYWFRRTTTAGAAPMLPGVITESTADPLPVEVVPAMSRLPVIETELRRVMSDVSGISSADFDAGATFLDQGLDSLSMTQATLELERVFGVRMRFRRLLEDLDTLGKLAVFLDREAPADKFAAPAMPRKTATATASLQTPSTALPSDAGASIVARQLQLIEEQLRLVRSMMDSNGASPMSAPSNATPAAVPDMQNAAEPAQPSVKALLDEPFGACARITLQSQQLTASQNAWLRDFTARYNAKSAQSKRFSQANRKLMSDPRVVTGFHPMWKDLVYPIVAVRSKGARLWDLDGNEYIDLLSAFGANLLGYQPDCVLQAMHEQLDAGIEVGPQHPLSAEVAHLIAEFTGMERVAFCNTGSEAVMGAMRIARTVTGRKTIAIFTNSYHGIFDEVIVRGTKQLRSLSAAPGILANAVENILVLDYGSDEALRVLKQRGRELAAIMIEPVQNKNPTFQPRQFVKSLREIADDSECALIFDEVVTGFRLAPGGAQEFYGVRADIATFGKVIGGGLPFAAIAGAARWLDALDGGQWQYGDDSYPEAGVTYFAGTFVRHPLALAAAKASLLHLKQGGRELYRRLNARTQGLVDRLNAAFMQRDAPVKAVHCASLWRLQWDDDQKYVSLFYYLSRFHGLHLYEQFGHFLTEAFDNAEVDRIVQVFTDALDELMAHGFITARGTVEPGAKKVFREPSTTKTEAALSPGQTERWLAASFDVNARRALNESFCVVLSGPVNEKALDQAIQDVLARHEAFRVRFDAENPRQYLQPAASIPVQHVDLSNQKDSDAALDDFCSEASLREFKLETPPLAAVSVLMLADGRRVVHVVASHLIFDGWASSVFNAELAQAYRARSLGVAPDLKPAESPLVFADREQARFASCDGDASLQFWTRALHNPPLPLALGDLKPAPPRSFAADTARMAIDGDLFARLRAQARQAGATLFQLLLTAVTLLLHKRSGQDDFVVSIPFASQSLERHGPLLADGVLDLPLRLTCTAAETPAAVLQRVRTRLMDALEQPLMTQGTAARALGIRSAGDRAPLTGVFFNLNPRVDLSGWAPLTASLHEGRKRGTLSELFFNFYEQTDALTLDLHYSTEYFSGTRARELVDSLRQICATLAVSLREAPQISVELEPRLLEWNATEAPLDAGARVEQWIARQAQQTPDAVAIEAVNGALTYGQLETRANQFGNLLHARGIGAGQLVGLCLSRGVDLVPALLGVLKTGAAYVPLDPAFPKERLHYMAEDAALALVVTESSHADLSGVERARQVRIDEDATAIAAAPITALHAGQWPGDAPMYVIYTSGSTGKPKGVIVPQRAVCNFLASMRKRPGLQAADRLLAVTTLSFDISVLELLLPLTLGARVVIAQREQAMDGEALARMLTEHRITVMQATPTTWHMLLDAGWQAPHGMRALCGGEPLPSALAARLLESGVELWNMYGPTETTVWSTLARITDAQKISIGGPIDNTQVWILDERRQPCAIGVEGEICIGGEGVALGYFKRPQLTADKFIADSFRKAPEAEVSRARLYRTGDLGRWCMDGCIEHLGRLDFQVKIRGHRIELGEIEACMEAVPGVARAVVLAREDSPDDVRLVGYFVAQAGALLDPVQMRDALRTELPDYMLPQHVVPLDDLPLLPNGKIDRNALPAPVGPALTALRTPSTPCTDTERVVAHAMQAVLKIPQVDVRDDFFSLGGHSLLAARLIGQLNRELGAQLALRTLFESPTVEKLAAAIDKQKGGAPARRMPIVHRTQQRSAPLTLMQERIRFMEEMFPGRVTYNLPSAHRLCGKLDAQAFDRAFAQMLKRQPSLRTTIVTNPAGGFMQLVNEADDFTLLPLEDLSHAPAARREQLLARRIEELTAQTFELHTFPLFKHRLIKLKDDEHVLFFMPHHAVWDGWSFDVFYAEIAALYAAAVAGREPELAPLPVTYCDFAHWHNQWLQSDEIRHQVEFWQGRYADAPLPKEPPADQPRRHMSAGRGATVWMHIDTTQAEKLRNLAKQTGSTMSIVALSVYAALMGDWLDDSCPAIGMPVRGRPAEELEGVMGFFNNLVPLRVAMNKSLPCLEWIKAVRQTVVEAFAHQDVPFEMLAQELQLNRKGAAARLYQVMFSFQDARQRQTRWGTLRHQRIPVVQKGATEDINLWMEELPSGIEGGIQYDADLFLPATAEALRDRFLRMLEQLLVDPSQSVEQLLHATALERSVAAKPAVVAATPAASGGLETALERTLAAIWSRLLAAPVVRPQDNFFELGGGSLLAMQMIAQVEQETGRRLNPRAVLLSSLRQLGRELERGPEKTRASGSVREAQPFFFGAGLFGILHRPQGRAARHGVLICAPIAQEYMRTHWLFRQLASQLARDGIAVMRFDYTGCGDSVGAQLAGGFRQWTKDAVAAAAELRQRADVERITVVGARLGACIAAAAFPQEDLVLWDPVRSGAHYLRELKTLQAHKPRGKSAADVLGLAGFEFSDALRAELEALSLQPLLDAARGAQQVIDSVQLGEQVGWADINYWQDAVLSARIVQALKSACAGGERDSRERALLRVG